MLEQTSETMYEFDEKRDDNTDFLNIVEGFDDTKKDEELQQADNEELQPKDDNDDVEDQNKP
mgnify:CR=1 FL=1